MSKILLRRSPPAQYSFRNYNQKTGISEDFTRYRDGASIRISPTGVVPDDYDGDVPHPLRHGKFPARIFETPDCAV
jgi:hypothetical protein